MVNHFGIDSILLSDRMRMSIIKVMRTSVFEAEKGIFFLSFFCIPDGVKKCVENLKQLDYSTTKKHFAFCLLLCKCSFIQVNPLHLTISLP